MKRIILLLSLTLVVTIAHSQVYTTSAGEMIFSFANVTQDGNEVKAPLRWSPVFNFGTNVHFDGGEYFGLFSGINVKNMGFITDITNDDGIVQKQVHRTYNLGIPVAIKIGNLNKVFVYGGYEFELPFHYKNKRWSGSDRSGDKTKWSSWFSKATPTTLHSVFVGLQLHGGANIKFRYYLTEYLNQGFVRNGETPNQGIEVQLFSISLSSSLLRGTELYTYSE